MDQYVEYNYYYEIHRNVPSYKKKMVLNVILCVCTFYTRLVVINVWI